MTHLFETFIMQIIESYIIFRRLFSDHGYFCIPLESVYRHKSVALCPLPPWLLTQVMGLGWESKYLLRTDRYKIIHTYIIKTMYKVIQVKILSSWEGTDLIIIAATGQPLG